MGQLVVKPGNPGHEADHRSDDGGPATPENSGDGGEEETEACGLIALCCG